MRQHFAKRALKAGIAGLAATVALSSVALAGGIGDFKVGSPGKLVPTKVQLGIIPPANNVCPGKGLLTAWVQTNHAGTVNILIVKKGGNVAGPYAIETTQGSGGVFMGSYAQKLTILNPIDAEYRVVVQGSTLASNWVPLQADC